MDAAFGKRSGCKVRTLEKLLAHGARGAFTERGIGKGWPDRAGLTKSGRLAGSKANYRKPAAGLGPPSSGTASTTRISSNAKRARSPAAHKRAPNGIG